MRATYVCSTKRHEPVTPVRSLTGPCLWNIKSLTRRIWTLGDLGFPSWRLLSLDPSLEYTRRARWILDTPKPRCTAY